MTLVWERGRNGWRGAAAAPSLFPMRCLPQSGGIGCCLLCRFNLPQKGQIPGGVRGVAWGRGGGRDCINDAQGDPVPEALLRSSCSSGSVITVLVKSVHALTLGLFFKIIIRMKDMMIFFSN